MSILSKSVKVPIIQSTLFKKHTSVLPIATCNGLHYNAVHYQIKKLVKNQKFQVTTVNTRHASQLHY